MPAVNCKPLFVEQFVFMNTYKLEKGKVTQHLSNCNMGKGDLGGFVYIVMMTSERIGGCRLTLYTVVQMKTLYWMPAH